MKEGHLARHFVRGYVCGKRFTTLREMPKPKVAKLNFRNPNGSRAWSRHRPVAPTDVSTKAGS